MLSFSGQPVGSLQSVKDNLRRMRWHHDRMASIPADVQRHNHNSNIVEHIADELLRYVWEASDNLYGKNSGNRKSDASGFQSNPQMIITALQNHQSRAEASFPID